MNIFRDSKKFSVGMELGNVKTESVNEKEKKGVDEFQA